SDSGFVGDEDLILGHLSETNARRAVNVQLVERAMSLSDDEAVGPRIANGAASAGTDRKFFRAKALLSADRAVDDPFVDVAFFIGAGCRYRLDVMLLLEIGIRVALPVHE